MLIAWVLKMNKYVNGRKILLS